MKFHLKKSKTMNMISIVLLLVFLIILSGSIITQHWVYTPPFKDSNGKRLTNSIAEFNRLKIGGCSQSLLIRGKNINNPVLLFLHAGPGLSETGMFRNQQAILEDYYTMVYYDQRGAAKSYSLFLDSKTITTEQLIADIHELTQYLKKRFAKNKIILMGHSFGAGFGALVASKYPDDYCAYIGIGQPVNPVETDRLSYSWTFEQAKKENNQKALKELENVDGYWTHKDQAGYFKGMMVNKRYVGYYGGQIVGERSFVPIVLKGLLSKEYNLFDYVPYLMGMNFSGKASWEILITADLIKQAPVFECPFILITGRHDYNVTPSLTETYFNFVKAPYKKQYWFENSAHFPHFEEKEKFQEIMIKEIYQLVSETEQ